MSETFHYTPEQERLLDHYDDQGITFDDARRMLGIQPIPEISEKPAPFRSPSDHKPSTPKARSGVQYGDGGRIETVNGEPDYENSSPLLTEAEIERHQRGSTMAKRTIQELTNKNE
jgi:hypothetical protein